MLETLPGTHQILQDGQHQPELTIAMVPSSSLVDAQAKVSTGDALGVAGAG